jgi:choline dehydrogenase-like flavoprotein
MKTGQFMTSDIQSSNPIYDFVIIGSGFGGSVSAMRLAEKGYRVLVLERGLRYEDEDFPKSNWVLWKFLWMPALRFFGIMELSLLRNVMAFSWSGVGGGRQNHESCSRANGQGEHIQKPSRRGLFRYTGSRGG